MNPRAAWHAVFGLAVFSVVAVFYIFLTWSPHLPVLGGDHAVYLLMADHFSPFAARDPALTGAVMQYAPHPPFYPMLLGLAGATSARIEFAHLVTTGFFLAFLCWYFAWLARETGSRVQAWLLSLLFALLPTTLLNNLGMQSENLYLLLTLAALWLAGRPDAGHSRLYAAAMLIGLAAVTRTIGVSLIAAFAIILFLSGNTRRYRLVLVSLVPLVIWYASKAVFGYEGGYLHTLSDILTRKPPGELLWNQLSVQGHALWSSWLTGFDPWPKPHTVAAGSLLLALCAAGTVRRARQGKLDGIYVLIYFGVLLLWPFSRETGRFLYPVAPLLLFHGLDLFMALLRQAAPQRARLYSGAYFAVVLLLALAALGTFGQRLSLALDENPSYMHFQDWYTADDPGKARETITAHQRLVRAWRRIPAAVPAGDCVYHVDPAVLMLYADRVSYAPPLAGTTREFRRLATSCRFFYLGSYTRIPFWASFYPADYIMEAARIVDAEHMEEARGRPLLGMLVEL